MTELQKKVAYLKKNNLTGISFFLTAGYPDMEGFKEIMVKMDRENLADFMEVGVPFSDPLADGPVIQESSRQAIKNGVTLGKIFNAVKELKKEISMPLLLMSYLNILVAGNLEKNLSGAVSSGFSGIIIPDLPLGESGEIEEKIKRAGLDHIFLSSPSTPPERIKKISEKSSPFMYYVSSYGVTGDPVRKGKRLAGRLKKIKKLSLSPVYCGFGISGPEQAAELKESLDGIIIGSAFIGKIKNRDFKPPLKFAISINKSLGRL